MSCGSRYGRRLYLFHCETGELLLYQSKEFDCDLDVLYPGSVPMTGECCVWWCVATSGRIILQPVNVKVGWGTEDFLNHHSTHSAYCGCQIVYPQVAALPVPASGLGEQKLACLSWRSSTQCGIFIQLLAAPMREVYWSILKIHGRRSGPSSIHGSCGINCFR